MREKQRECYPQLCSLSAVEGTTRAHLTRTTGLARLAAKQIGVPSAVTQRASESAAGSGLRLRIAWFTYGNVLAFPNEKKHPYTPRPSTRTHLAPLG